MLAIKVNKDIAEEIRAEIYKKNMLDNTRKIRLEKENLIIPIKGYLEIEKCEIIDDSDYEIRKENKVPYQKILENIGISEELKKFLPIKWERYGKVLVIKLDEKLKSYETEIGQKYAEILGVQTVLKDEEGIKGTTRKPQFKIIYGTETETLHIENGISYKFDAKEIMFSSGNNWERMRMSNIDLKDEIIVDMFAGIGYFTLPMAIYGKPKKIYACEINPKAYQYLKENIKLNKVEDTVEPLLGDNRDIAPLNVADRIIMGYIRTSPFLDKAMQILKNHEGTIHYHDILVHEKLDTEPLKTLQNIGEKFDRKCKILYQNIVKSYAPYIWHVVTDIRFIK